MAEIDHEDAFPEGLPSRKGKTDKEEFYERFPRLPREYSTEDIQAITPAKKTTDASSALQDIQKFIGEDQYTKWRKQGEIGGIENARRKRSNLMGDLVNLATAGTPEIAAMGGNKSIPEIFRSPTARMIRLENAAKRYQKGKYEDQDEKGDGEKLREADAQMLLDFLMELEEERVRGTSIAGDIAAGYVELPQFMLSFVLSGGLGSLAQQGVRRGLAGWVRGTATEAGKRSVKEGVKRGVKRTIRGAAEFSAKTAAQTLAMPQEVYRNYAKRSAMSNFDVTDKGWSVLDSAKESPATNLLKAVGDVLIEVGSESAGHYLNKMMPRGLREGLEKMYLLKNPGGNPKDLWNRIAFNGMIAEIGEEQLGDYMRALTGIEDFGAENPDSILERLVASQYGWRELFVTAGVIAPLSVGYSIHNRQVAKKRSDTFHVREQQIQEIVAAAEKQQLRTSSDVETDLEKSSERVASAKTRAEKEAAILEQKELKTEHEEKISRERALVVEGRVAKLTADINATEEELVRLEKQLEEAAKQGKSTTNLEQQIAKQQEKFDLLDEQIAEIQLDSKAALGERKQEREAASSLSTTVAGFRKKVKGKEVTVTHGDMKAAKKDATKAVKSSTLSADEQAAAIESFTHETDPKALAQTLGKISRRLNNIAKGIRGGDEILTTPSRVMATVLHRARTTRRLTQEEGKAARAALIDALNRSDLTKDQKAEFLTTIKNIDTFDKLMKELPSILERVVAKEEELKRSRLLATIRRRLSGAHPKMRSGKPVGKLTPELQKRLKKIEEFSEFDEEQRDNRLFANIQALDTDTLAGVELTDEMRTELRLDNAIISLVANIDGKNSQELEGILKEVNAIILQGKSLHKAKVEAENVRKKELVDNSLKSISFRDGAIKDLKALAAKIKEWTTQKITRSTLFHGSSIEIQELVDDVYTSGNIYGQGFYTTDDADIALGYTKKGSKKAATDGTYAPTVYSVEVKGAPVLYDMETPMGMELIEELRGKHKHLSWLLSSSNVDETTTLRSIYDRIRSRSKQRLITADRAQEMFAAFRKSLEDSGYDGLQHTGGLLTGNKPHKVSIFFSPTKSVKLHKIDAASPKEKKPKPKKKKAPEVDIKKVDTEQQESFDDVVESVSLTRAPLEGRPTSEGKISTEEYLEQAGVDPKTLKQLKSSDPMKRVKAREKITKLLVEGKIKAIEEERAPLEKEFYELMERRSMLPSDEQLAEADRTRSKKAEAILDRISKRIGELFTQLDEMDSDVHHLKTSAAPFVTTEFTERIVTTNQKIYRAVAAIEKELRKEAAEQVEAAIKGTRKTIKETQAKLIKLINQSGLGHNDQAKFLKKIENTQTPQDLLRELEPGVYASGKNKGKPRPGLLDRIQNLLDKAERRALKASIKKSFKRGKPTSTYGRKIAKLADPYRQQELTLLQQASKLTKEQAAERMNVLRDQSSEGMNQDQIDDRQAEMRALSFAGGYETSGKGKDKTEMSLEQMRELDAHLRDLVLFGKPAWGLVVANRKLAQIAHVGDAMSTIDKGVAKLYDQWLELESARVEAQLLNEPEQVKLLSEAIGNIKEVIVSKLSSQTEVKSDSWRSLESGTLFTGIYSMNSFDTLVDIASVRDKSGKYESTLSKMTSTGPVESEAFAALKQEEAVYTEAYEDAYGRAEAPKETLLRSHLLGKLYTKAKEGWHKHWSWIAHQEKFILKTFKITNAQGGSNSVQASTEDLMGLYAALLDEKTGKQIAEGRPFTMGGTVFTGMSEDMMYQFFDGPNGLTKADKKYVNNLMGLMQTKHGPELRAEVARQDGILIPLHRSYWPQSSEAENMTTFDSILHSHLGASASTTTPQQKERTSTSTPLIIKPATQVYHSYVNTKNHYIHFTDHTRMLTNIFGDPNVKRVLEQRHGESFIKEVEGFLEFFKKGHEERGNKISQFVDALRANMSVSTLGALKIPNMVKQMASTPAMKEGMAPGSTWKDFYDGMVEFLKSPVENYKVLLETGFLQERERGGRTLEHRDLIQKEGLLRMATKSWAPASVQKWVNILRLSPTAINAMMVHVHVGDVSAIGLGGWPVYVSWKKKYQADGMSEAEAHANALRRFVEVGKRTQQYTGMSERTGVTRMGAFPRSVTHFKQALSQYLQSYISTIRNGLAGNLKKGELRDAILIHHLLLPNLFLAVTTIVSDDDEEAKISDHVLATLSGPISGFYLFGDLGRQMLTKAFNYVLEDLGADATEYRFSDAAPIWSIFRDIYDGKVVQGVGKATGIPTKRIGDGFEGLSDIIDGDIWDGFLEVIGYTPRQVKGQPKKKPKAPKLGF